MANVKVRVNQYAPGREWRRLFRNRGVHPVWRYTLGILTCVQYTILPGRVFGGDHYNPYTNTISLYSDLKPIALHEAAHAKDFARKKRVWRGWYAAVRILPLVPLWQEAVASTDAISYDRESGQAEDEKEDYRVLYPAYGTYISGEVLQWIPVETWVSYAATYTAALVGHVVGRIKTLTVPEPQEPDGATDPEADRPATALPPFSRAIVVRAE
jgi:hypothetical protein